MGCFAPWARSSLSFGVWGAGETLAGTVGARDGSEGLGGFEGASALDFGDTGGGHYTQGASGRIEADLRQEVASSVAAHQTALDGQAMASRLSEDAIAKLRLARWDAAFAAQAEEESRSRVAIKEEEWGHWSHGASELLILQGSEQRRAKAVVAARAVLLARSTAILGEEGDSRAAIAG